MRYCIKRFIFRILLLILFAVFLLIGLRFKYHDVILSLAQTKVMNTTSDMINDAIDRQIEDGKIQYDRIVYFEKDLDGNITALKTNMSEVNRLKTDILNIINDDIIALDTTGKGIEIPIQIISIRNSEASLHSDFSEAGINQTLHQLNMHFSVDVSVLVLGHVDNFTVASQVIVAETVIVGQVPQTLLQTGG